MARGTVKWFNSTVERAGLSSLNEGQQIEFEIEENRGKSSAVNLRAR
jgi:CspA family cold shock protein